MSQENVDTVRAVYENWGRGNFRAGGDLFDPHIVCVVSPESPEPGVYVGPEQIRGWMRTQLSAWDRMTVSAEELIEAGDSVVVAVRRCGVGRGGGTPVEGRHFDVWTFRGRSVIRFELIRDRAEALEAVGLSE